MIRSRSAARARGLAALGLTLAPRGPLAIVAIAFGAVTALACVALAFILAHGRALADVPAIAASALAWGAGMMLAFTATTHALRRDRDAGILALVQRCGGTTGEYIGARAAGLFAWIAVVVVGGTFLAGLAATAIAPPADAARIARSSGPALAYAVAFSATIAPVALATLGARSRAGGYVGLLLVVFIPELLESITSTCVPDAWRNVTSIPAALTALRRALMPAVDSAIDGPEALRACAVLGAIIVVALVVVRQQVARVDAELARFP